MTQLDRTTSALLSLPLDLARVTQWRHQLHSQPETGFAVHDTAALIAQLLEEFGLQVHRGIGQTGVVGVLKGNKPPTQPEQASRSIGLRADMDALAIHEANTFAHRSQRPGAMHACGHDGHSAMLLGAAQALAQAPHFCGTVYFIFQPNEEHGLGAQAMIDDGLFEHFPMQAVYGLHNMPSMPQGQIGLRSGGIMASEDNFFITIKGRGGHASQPHHHIDPLVIGAEIVLALQTIVARSIDAQEQAVVSVTEFITDGTVNVIPSEVTIKGDCRAFNPRVQERIRQQMHQLCQGICSAHGATLEFEYRHVFQPTINHEAPTQVAHQAALKAAGPHQVCYPCRPLMGSEDFAAMLAVTPGCYALIGNGIDSQGGCMLHNSHYDFNDDI